ncbi:hypothetical protein [Achromobacter pulmonis]|jgi:hypothetical protein|uniref:hypothetical protein n=1 Tax=Achromobacter pulmonis TaxID=1389932 RepID=UPI0011B2778E|nr:hypothetical protein [Achromobacter pulmonis]
MAVFLTGVSYARTVDPAAKSVQIQYLLKKAYQFDGMSGFSAVFIGKTGLDANMSCAFKLQKKQHSRRACAACCARRRRTLFARSSGPAS